VEHDETSPIDYGLEQSCPPQFLVRAAVLEPDETILSHVAQCRRCGDAFLSAMGANCLDAGPPRTRRTTDWIARLAGSVRSALQVPAARPALRSQRPAGLRSAMGAVK
jgi:ribosomal protein L37E